MQKKHKGVPEKYKEQEKRRKLITKKKRTKEKREGITKCKSLSLYQSNREPLKEASSWSPELSLSSNIC